MLIGDIKGWTDSLKDPSAGAKLAATVYGKDLGLDQAEQTLESTAQNTVVQTDDTKANGLFTITDEAHRRDHRDARPRRSDHHQGAAVRPLRARPRSTPRTPSLKASA